jgi:hypothetical protein
MPLALSGSLVLSGSISTTGAITMSGSIASASYAALATTASNANTSSYVVSSVTDTTQNSRLASNEAKTGSFATTGSNAFTGSQSVSGSLTLTGTITAQTLVVQTITSSVEYSSGSNVFGSNTGNTHQFTGSVLVSGSLNVNSGSLFVGSNNQIGINTLSPQSQFVVGKSTNSASVEINLNNSGYGRIFAYDRIAGAAANLILNDPGGNVGIGTTAPFAGAKLQVKTATNINLSIQTGTTETTGVKLNAFNDAADTNIPMELNGSVVLLKTGETERMRITSGGNVGIGETSPSSMLHFSRQTTWGTSDNRIININNSGTGGDINTAHNMGSITWYSGNSTPTAEIAAYRNTPSSGNNVELRFYTAAAGTPAERLRITSGGSVGIGTTSPGYNLHVVGDVFASNSIVTPSWNYSTANANMTVYNSADAGGILLKAGVTSGYVSSIQLIGNYATTNPGTLIFSTANAERMRISSAGQVTIPSQPAWSVGRSTAQSFSSGTPTTINWDQSSGNDCFIQGGVTLNSGNGRITVPVAGKYVILVSIRTEDPGAATGTNLNFRKNGGTILRYYVGTSVNSAGTFMYLETRPVVVSCAANDYLDFYFDTVNSNFTISAVTNTVVRFSGYLVG